MSGARGDLTLVAVAAADLAACVALLYACVTAGSVGWMIVFGAATVVCALTAGALGVCLLASADLDDGGAPW